MHRNDSSQLAQPVYRLRLTKHQRATIKALVIEVFGSGALVWLFGSRVDDCRRGGDIDLLIETHQMDAMAIERAEIKFQTQLQKAIGDQKIDVLVAYPSRKHYQPIFRVAKQTGVLI